MRLLPCYQAEDRRLHDVEADARFVAVARSKTPRHRAEEMDVAEKNGFFGEVISSYTLEQAVEDGVLIDFGNIKRLTFRIIMTRGIVADLTKHQLLHVLVRSLNILEFGSKPDMIVFKIEPVKKHLEDEGRTLITHLEGLEKQVYAKLDGTILTIMLSSDY